MAEIHDSELLAALSRDDRLAVILVDRQGVVRWWSDGARALFGQEAVQMLGASAQILVPPPMRAAHLGCFARGFAPSWRGSSGWDAIEGWSAAQAPVALEVFLTPLRDGEGGVRAVLGLFRKPAAG